MVGRKKDESLDDDDVVNWTGKFHNSSTSYKSNVNEKNELGHDHGCQHIFG